MCNRRLVSLLFAAFAIHAPIAAQQTASPPRAQQFWFDGYRSVMRLDMRALRDSGVWEEIEASALRMVLGMIEEQVGFPLDRLDRVTSVRTPVLVDGEVARFDDVTTVEGNGDLGDPSADYGDRYGAEQLGTSTLYVDGWNDREAVATVTPKLRVHGPTDYVRAVLRGKPSPGVPSGDVMSFTAGKTGLLAYFVVDLRQQDEPRRALLRALPDARWPEGDEPTLACGRMHTSGDEDDPHVTLELVLRHGMQGDGLDVTEKAVQKALDELGKVQQARLFRPVLKKIARRRDGTDIVWSVDLGRAREAAGLLGMLAPFALTAGARPVPVKAVQRVQLEEVEEVEEEPVEEPGEGGGR